MRPRSLSLLLLICLALRLGAGPHPCHARTAPAAPAASSAHCHGMPAPAPKPADQEDDCCDPRTGDHSLCEQGCQRAAVLRVALALPAVQAFEELAAPTQVRPETSFAFPIDHVPLA